MCDRKNRDPQSVKIHRPHPHFSFHLHKLCSSPVVTNFIWRTEPVAGENTLSPAMKVMYNFLCCLF